MIAPGFEAGRNHAPLPQSIKIDTNITFENISIGNVKQLEMLEPFGEQNDPPVFSYKNLKIDSIRALSEGKHLKLVLRDKNQTINAIGFNMGDLANEYIIGDNIDIVGKLEINRYNGDESIQFNLIDIR
ncbi:MAG: hypothetical protein FWC68_03995 [Oscillospiraceae bacterium]|nr:hypothetical protein [Oscillospiraceae bacterium]